MPVRSDVEPILTVNTPADSYDLVTLDVMKDELGLTVTTYDARLSRWITSASNRAMNYTNRVFAVETVTEVWRMPLWRHPSPWLPASGELIISRWPIQTFHSVVEDANPSLTLNTDFEADVRSGQLWRLDQLANRIHWNTQTVTVSYDGGYAADDPRLDDATQAVILLVKLRFAEQGARDPNLIRENIPGVVERQWWVPAAKESSLPPDVQGLLDTYREVLV
jgi:hypothetical protein